MAGVAFAVVAPCMAVPLYPLAPESMTAPLVVGQEGSSKYQFDVGTALKAGLKVAITAAQPLKVGLTVQVMLCTPAALTI